MLTHDPSTVQAQVRRRAFEPWGASTDPETGGIDQIEIQRQRANI